MRTLMQFMSHRFTIRQSLLVIGSSLLMALAASEASEAAGLPRTAVAITGLAAAAATFTPITAVLYRRSRA